MISVPQSWLFAYNSVVLTGILITNIIVVVRYTVLDWRERKLQSSKPPTEKP